MSDMLTIGIQSLQAYQYALVVTSQNMANVDNDYYARRVVSFADAMFDNGVVVSDVQRVYETSVSQTLMNANSNFSMSDILEQQMVQLEQLLDNSQNSISAYLSTTLTSLRDLSSSPDNPNSRALFLQQLTLLCNRFNDMSAQMQLQEENANQSIASIASDVNQLTDSIAAINRQITSNGSNPNLDLSSLLDQRETLVQTLAQYCNLTTEIDNTGALNISIGNGVYLVLGNTANQLVTQTSLVYSNDVDVVLQTQAGNITITNNLTNGQLGGLISFLNNSLEPTQRAMDRLAVVFMSQLNNQNNLGIDGNGLFGDDIFQNINDPIFSANRALANGNNTGSEVMNVVIDNASQLTTSDYELTFATATSYNLVRQSDGVVVSSGTVSSLPQAISADGFTINLNSGTIAANDKFLILPAAYASSNIAVTISDPEQLALAWPVATQPGLTNTGAGATTITAITDVTSGTFSTPGQLNPPILIKFTSPTTYDIINASTNVVMQSAIPYTPSANNAIFPSPAPVAYDPGYRISLTGTVNTGDTFNINFNTNFAADNKNAKAMESLFTAALVQDNTLTFNTAYDNLSIAVSTQTNGVKINYSSNQTLLDQAEFSYGQISGVDVQEEHVNLMRYEQAYQASAQIIQAAKTVFDTIIGLGGR